MILLTARRASVSGAAPWYSAGYSIAPTPMIVPWPTISRGTEWTVPMVPGLVRVIVVPAKSSAVSLLLRARRTMSSYAAQNSANVMPSAPLMDGTSSDREPSGFWTSMARPKFTCSGLTTAGLPSTSVKPLFISGISASALTTAKPIRWVKETLPPRPRCSALLMTVRLSMSSLAGTARTLVAVGTARLAFMLVTTRAAGPLSGVGPDGAGLVDATGCGPADSAAAGFAPADGSSPRRPSARQPSAGSAWSPGRGLRLDRRLLLHRRGPVGAGPGAGRGRGRGGGGGRGGTGGLPAGVTAVGAASLGRAPVERLVVLEEVPPRLVDRALVLQVLLVELVHEPLVRPEVGRL